MDDEVPNLYQQYEEVKYKLRELEETYEVNGYKRLSDLIVNIRDSIEYDVQKNCKHVDKKVTSTDTDSYECRSYVSFFCPRCGKQWEERGKGGNL